MQRGVVAEAGCKEGWGLRLGAKRGGAECKVGWGLRLGGKWGGG